MLGTFVLGEVTSRSIVPMHKFLLTEESEKTKNDENSCLFTEIKLSVGLPVKPGKVIVGFPAKTEEQDIIDEAFINFEQFTNLVNNPNPTPPSRPETVTIVGAGVSGLCAAYELKRAGYKVNVIEASSRVGGRVITFRDPVLAPGLHAEGGAMRIPGDHYLLRLYLDIFGLSTQLIPFEMENKVIYLSGLPEGQRTLTYSDFNSKLVKQDPELLKLFPNLKSEERGKNCDQLFNDAVKPVKARWLEVYKKEGGRFQPPYPVKALVAAYQAITDKYDKYTLRSYLTEVALWSEDAINLYDLGNAHVVFENGFIESFKDAFLSSNEGGSAARMQQLQSGMDAVPRAFAEMCPGEQNPDPVMNHITFGARVKHIALKKANEKTAGTGREKVLCYYDNPAGKEISVESDYLILAIPYTAQRAITKDHAFAPRQEMAVRDVRYVEVTKVLLQYKERWWKNQFSQKDLGTDGGVVCDLPIRYTMFPKETDGEGTAGNTVEQFKNTSRGAIMAAYTFEQDATILGALAPARRAQLAARDIDTIFPGANSLALLEAATAQVFPSDELAGGSAFCYFGPGQKSQYLTTMCKPDWDDRVFFAGEQASYTHGWIQGALEAALRCVIQIQKQPFVA